MDYHGRQKIQQALLADHHLDALLVTHLPNIRYLCGFTGSSGVLLISECRCVFFTDGRYTEQAKEEVHGAKIVIGRKNALILAAEWLARKFKVVRGTAGIEADRLTVAQSKLLREKLPRSIRIKSAPAIVENARMIKDASEIALIRRAVLMGAQLFDKILPIIRPGTKEIEIAAEMEYLAHKAGASEMSFPTIIASGARSALPHGRASGSALANDGFVVCDFGVILASYCSDQTRTIALGQTSTEARHAYEAVKDAQAAAVETVKPGASFADPDQAARKLLKKRKLAEYFTHSTGHGVGLEIHESPRLAVGQNGIFQPGMVVTIEPGVYVPGKFGVRIEDMLLVTDNGYEVLTPTSKELIEI